MSELIWRGDLAEQIAKAAAMEALHTGAEAVLTESHDEVPHDSGTLMRSGTVTDVPTENAVYISYNTPYAVKMHEDLSLNHPKGRKPKYLEDPFNRLAPKIMKSVETCIKNTLNSK